MSARHRVCELALLGAACWASATTAQAAVFGGVEFPQGASSFADAVASFDPVIQSGQPTAPNLVPGRAIGAPDYDGTNNGAKFVSLGDGGSITLEFVDNRLTGSGDNKLDLWIFEVGPDVEDTFVEISKDGNTWSAVGKVLGSTRGIDVDAYGFTQSDLFRFVRLTDDGALDAQSGSTVGADIDAIGAISSVVRPPIPEPATFSMLLGGMTLLALGARRRRR